MKVLLVAIHHSLSPQAVPLANAYLKAYLSTDEELASAVSVELCDLCSPVDVAGAAAAILAHAPDAVGFSLYLWNRATILELVAVLRRDRPDLTIFAGGPEVTATPERILSAAPFDFLIVGEGEIPFLEVVGRLHAGQSPCGAPGTAYRGEGGAVVQPQRAVHLLDTIPSPLLTGALAVERYPGLLWQLSRGCDFGCDYCFDYRGERGARRFSLDRVDAELDFLVRSNVSQVFVLDSTFNVDRHRAKTILRMIRKRAPHIHFHFEVRSEFLDREMAGLFASITCSLQIGLQSADPAVLKKVKRLFDPRDFIGKVSLLNETGAIFGFDLIYGLPGDTLPGFRASLDFALRLYPNHLDIFPLAVLPGTPLAFRARAAGLDCLGEPPYTLEGSPSFPPADMAEARRLASATDIFYSRGRAVAWFGSVITALKLSPASFLERFGRWFRSQPDAATTEQELSDHRIWVLQREFLQHIFSRHHAGKILPAALDLIDYHHHYAAALLAPPPEIPTDRELSNLDVLALSCSISPSTQLARFSYEIVDLLEAGEIDLREFVACFAPAGSQAAIYPRGEEVYTESLLEPHFLLLESLDGVTSAGQIASRLGISADEAASFLEFAVAEGMVIF